jgi:hypothetical protein
MTSVDAPRREIRSMLLAAIKAAGHGVPADATLARSVRDGDRHLTLDAFEFDSLAWMEFCISVENQSGHDLTPAEIVDMRYFFEIEDWVYARI